MATPLPPILETKLADFRRRVWTVKLAEGLLAALFGIVLSFLAVFVLDRFGETPGWLRLTILVAGAATLGLGLPLKWHRWVWRQRRLEDAARLLRRTFPRLGDQLLGTVELARQDHAAAGRSERLVQAAMAQAAEAVRGKDFTGAVPQARHRQWAWAAAGAVALAVAAFGAVNHAARNAFARWLLPLGETRRYTFAKVEPLPRTLVVPYAEGFKLPVKLAAWTVWSPAEGSGTIKGQPGVTAPLKDGGYALSFAPQKQDAPLAVSLGDVRKTVLIEPRPRPELAELTTRIRLPAYLQYRTEPTVAVRGGSVSVLKGAQAAFEAKASRPLAAAELDGQAQAVAGETISTGYTPVEGDVDRKFTWRDTDGLTPRDPLVLKVHAAADEPPRIVAKRESLEQVVLDSEVVTFEVNATDDFGVKQIGLEWTGSVPGPDGKTPVHGEKIVAVGAPEQKLLPARATFCATREGVAPQAVEIKAWTEDYLPGRAHARSGSFVLQVLNKTDHALWLTEQFGKWLEVAKETYEREQQLHETNQELRALTPEELDRPENRRRVAQQASAETANAARLDSLNQSGRSLVEQATKNDEFDAQRLETWATMLKSLKDIASHRMPSVSDLLKQTANATPGKLANAGNPNNGQNGNTAPTQPQPKADGQPQNPSAGTAKNGLSLAQGASQPPANPQAGAPTDPNATPRPVAPSLAVRDGGFGQPPEAPAADPNAVPKPPSKGKLTLPTNALGALADHKKKPEDDAKPPESPAQEKMENTVQEQRDLLAEFAKVSDQLSDILGSLEASTFVKRFKGASKQQMQMASRISTRTLDAFGVAHDPPKAAEPIARTAKEQSEVVRTIQNDLDAYSQRKGDAHFKNVLKEMRQTEIVRELGRDGEKVAINLTGEGMIGSEFWADTLDRWGEEMVAASQCKSSSCRGGDSLPPEIVLKVMQALRDEMHLRDETREMETAKAGLPAEKFTDGAKGLATKQGQIGEQVGGAADDIRALPQGTEKFPKELKLLTAVTGVMNEAHDLLDTPETGPRTVAAETEAIELLLQSKRQDPKGGGGGGSTPGGGGQGSTSHAALADLGPGADASSTVAMRPVGQATGRAGKEFPDEFKGGLDAYFNLLEGEGKRE